MFQFNQLFLDGLFTLPLTILSIWALCRSKRVSYFKLIYFTSLLVGIASYIYTFNIFANYKLYLIYILLFLFGAMFFSTFSSLIQMNSKKTHKAKSRAMMKLPLVGGLMCCTIIKFFGAIWFPVFYAMGLISVLILLLKLREIPVISKYLLLIATILGIVAYLPSFFDHSFGTIIYYIRNLLLLFSMANYIVSMMFMESKSV